MNLVKNINKLTLSAAVAGGALLLAGQAMAGPSSAAEFRGYSQCVEHAQATEGNLITRDSYLIKKHADHNQYFINATGWVDGERTPLRISCQTSKTGRQLLSQQVATGKYVNHAEAARLRVADR